MATATDAPPNLKSFMDDPIFKIDQTEPTPKPDKEPDGKTDTSQRPPVSQPAPKPAVARDATASGADPSKGKSATDKPKPDAKAEDWETAPPPKDQSAWDKWKTNRREAEARLKAETKTATDKLAEIESKLSEAQTKAETLGEVSPSLKAKIDKYETQIKELNDTIIRLGVERHPDFMKHYDGEMSQAIERAKKLVGTEHAEVVEKLLKIPDRDFRNERLKDFFADLDSEYIKGRLEKIADKIEDIEDEKTKEIARSKSLKEQWEADETLKRDAEGKGRLESFNKVLQVMQDGKQGLGPYQTKDGDAAWNESVEKRVALVKSVLTGKAPNGQQIPYETIVRGAFFAGAFPQVLKQFADAEAAWESEKATLESQIAELKSAQPGGGAPAQPQSTETKINRDMDPASVAKMFAQDAVKLFRSGA